jgi:hypothetical protein
MRRALWIIAIVIIVLAAVLAVAGCKVDSPQGGVPTGVTVTIPEGL